MPRMGTRSLPSASWNGSSQCETKQCVRRAYNLLQLGSCMSNNSSLCAFSTISHTDKEKQSSALSSPWPNRLIRGSNFPGNRNNPLGCKTFRRCMERCRMGGCQGNSSGQMGWAATRVVKDFWLQERSKPPWPVMENNGESPWERPCACCQCAWFFPVGFEIQRRASPWRDGVGSDGEHKGCWYSTWHLDKAVGRTLKPM